MNLCQCRGKIRIIRGNLHYLAQQVYFSAAFSFDHILSKLVIYADLTTFLQEPMRLPSLGVLVRWHACLP